jgi:hypothetical protein
LFWGEQQAIAALVAVACNLFVPGVDWVFFAERPNRVDRPLAVDCTNLASIFSFMILFCLKVLLASGAGLVMTALL